MLFRSLNGMTRSYPVMPLRTPPWRRLELADSGEPPQVTLRSDVIFPVAARVEVRDDVQMLLTATIPREGVRGLYPSDVWVVRLPSRPNDE